MNAATQKLIAAVAGLNAASVEEALAAGADPNTVMPGGNVTLLMSLMKMHRAAIVRLLLEHGADPNVKNPAGETALHVAMDERHQEEIIELLLSHGADVNAQRPRDGANALHQAINYAFIQDRLSYLEIVLGYEPDPYLKADFDGDKVDAFEAARRCSHHPGMPYPVDSLTPVKKYWSEYEEKRLAQEKAAAAIVIDDKRKALQVLGRAAKNLKL